jgi:hypothetical protein
MALITATQVIDTAFTNKNTDTYLIKPAFIQIAELNHVRPNIGEKLYELISNEVNASVVWTNVNAACVVTSGNTTITTAADSFIKVGDFVTGIELPVNADSEGKGLCKVETVDIPGAVTSFTISGTPTATNATASLTFRRPNGVLKEDFLVNYLAFCVKFEVMPDMTYNTTSQGVVENVADFTLPVSQKKLSFLRQETFKKSETYLRSMSDFICENQEVYPDYCNPNAGGVSKKHGIIIY